MYLQKSTDNITIPGRCLARLLTSCVVLLLLNTTQAAESEHELITNGLKFSEQGQYELAIIQWQRALEAFVRLDDKQNQARTLLYLGVTYQSIGEYRQATQALMKASEQARQTEDTALQYNITASHASVHAAMGNLKLAEKLLEKTMFAAKQNNDFTLQAALLNDHANILAARDSHNDSKLKYYQSLQISKQHGLIDQQIRALINLAALSVAKNDYADYISTINKAHKLIAGQESNYQQGVYRLRVSELILSMQHKHSKGEEENYKLAHSLLTEASNIFKLSRNNEQMSYAAGLLGQLYMDTGNYANAGIMMQRAIFMAQQIQAPGLIYRWQWSLGRLYRKQGRDDEAIQPYRQARSAYEKLHPLFMWTHVDTPKDDDTPVVFHYELADLLLSLANLAQKTESSTALLTEAMHTIEGLKTAELQDYFRDSCVARTRTTIEPSVLPGSSTTMIIYPVVFSDRVELLVSIGDRLLRFTTKVPASELKKNILLLRSQLEKRRTREYLPAATQLYDWLIRPLERELVNKQITTLVFVPDLKLRSLPFASLHDGEKFLIEKVAIATSPSLALTDQRVSREGREIVLLAGITSSIQGFPALIHVKTELSNIQEIYPGDKIIDAEFSYQQLSEKMASEKYTIAHIASHGEFSKYVNDSFILAYDQKITVNDLSQLIGASRFRPQPLDLLTLSACYTAAGDDHAALGLAGITVKAGARSALATLWPVNDLATADFMTEFYIQLKNRHTGKAQALQNAQLRMLQDKRYRHPGYWAPYLLIGSWL